MRTLSPSVVRRLAVAKQRLSDPPPANDRAGMLGLFRDLGCVQLDPISVVARSHQLVLFSRLGKYDLAHLDRLLWEERSLFEYWAHEASIVPTADYPIHNLFMRTYAAGAPRSQTAKRYYAWLKDNAGLRRHILKEIRRQGPLPSRYFDDKAAADWSSTGWTAGRNVGQMLDYLWTKGKILVAGRSGIQKLWDVSERVLPDWTPRHRLPQREVVYQAAQTALRALGVATPRHIQRHFTRGRYPNLEKTLDRLETDGRVERVQIGDWPGDWYIHTDDLVAVERLEKGDWRPRTALLSPFDNLICDRQRTRWMFDFDFAIEIYVPAAKRRYGYYVLPILHGDRLIGRVDPRMDRDRGVLKVNAVYAEPDAPKTRRAARAVRRALGQLADFLGAADIEYDRRRLPAVWKRDLLA